MKPMKFGIGQPMRRVEDERFITGAGRYTADVMPAGSSRRHVPAFAARAMRAS